MSALVALALAQAAEAPIVVRGRRPDPVDALRRQVRRVSARSGDQLARFAEPVCPLVLGMAEPQATAFAARMRADAEEAGIEVAKAPCRPNLTVAIVPDGRAALRQLRRERPALFRGIPPASLQAALAEPGPARIVTVTQLRSRDGRSPSPDWSQGHNGPAGGAPTLLVEIASNLVLTTRQDLDGALLLLDAGAIEGKRLHQLADYAAMRTLARTRAAEAEDDTILSLFARADAPRGLTGFDRAYLRALYHGPPTQTFRAKTGGIARAIARRPAD